MPADVPPPSDPLDLVTWAGLRDFLAGDTIRSDRWGPGLTLDGRILRAIEPVRVAVIGCGNHARGALHPNIARLPHFDYVAVCDLDRGAAAECARRYGASTVHTDYRAMLDEVRPEAVVVCGGASLHHDAGSEIVARGIHLFVEKPTAPTVEGALELAEAAETAGVVNVVGLFWRHAAAHRIAAHLMAQPAFGRPMLYDGAYLAPGPRAGSPDFPDVRWAYVADQAIHAVDAMRFLMGEVTEVRVTRSEGDAGALGFAVGVTFVGGAVGSLALASFTNTFSLRVAVHGSAGESIEIVDNEGVRIHGRAVIPGSRAGYVDQNVVEWRQSWSYAGHLRAGYLEELTAFAVAVREGTPTGATLRDAAIDLAVCRAILESAETGRAVAPTS
ncbi:MAG TPA: Gfo/Idh/MocA family oxidoreductase [Candidatus Limnocylindrales bacterium]|nr:Gfo/Idh/MocA family oxidoreductase [Candidatus Limnocylindrales bacterium]